jgi:hypothetical protein
MAAFRRFMAQESTRRRIALAGVVYALTTIVYFAFAARSTLTTHTPWNHFALLADAWIHGRLDLGGPPPAYAGTNEFAEFRGKWYVTFPPFPALLLVPLVKLGGGAGRVQDGQFFIWIAGIAPAVLFLALEKLKRMGSGRSTETNVLLALLFAFGTVYFFTAEQGTVWFAAHVVGAALAALYLRFALEAERPVLAGLVLGLAFLTRPPILFAAPLFLFEAWRVSQRARAVDHPLERPAAEQLELRLDAGREQLELPLGAPPEGGEATASSEPARKSAPAERSLVGKFKEAFARVDLRRVARLYAAFAVPIVLLIALSFLHNRARFDDAFETGYRYLTVAWRPRMEKWGLFSYHYLPRNLGVILTSLPWVNLPADKVPFQINLHGLALWVTTPAFLWLLWPRRTHPPHFALWISVLLVAIPTLFYQNTGWLQFGYRFSNDYSVFLFALLAIGGQRLRALFWALAVWAVAVNAFGAKTFGRPEYQRYYYQDASQRVFYQPD